MVHSEGNLFSILALFLWIPFAFWGVQRWPPAKAAALLLLLPLMFLPEQVHLKLPGLPTFDKQRLAVLWLLVGVMLFHRERLRSIRVGWPVLAAIIVVLTGSVITVFSNSDPISFGSVFKPNHVPYDAVHAVIQASFDSVLPFVFGAAMFTGQKDLRTLFRTLVIAGLMYSVLQLIEIRLSPQLHNWVYGFFPHSFKQTIRAGGYRPTVFMEHGLAVAMLTVVAIIAAAALYKTRLSLGRLKSRWVMIYLWIVLLMSESLAALLYSVAAVPFVLFGKPKNQFRFAVVLAVLVLAYPWVRGAGLVPVEAIQERVEAEFGDDRAGSLMTRFVNEELLLERADERYFFGWGWYGRAYVYDEDTGRAEAIRDGDWIITVGDWGRVGFLAKYLLMLLPVFIAFRRSRSIRGERDRRLLAALALIVALSAFDLLPNGNFNYLVFVFSGALLSCSAGILRSEARLRARRKKGMRPSSQPEPSRDPNPAYAGAPPKPAPAS